ncbi:MAG: family 2 glycosyl transferase, partial [bacterium]
AQQYFQREEFDRVARMMAGALEKNPQSIPLQFNYVAALSMLGYLDYVWRISCYIVAQLINTEDHPWTEKFFDNMTRLFFTITHSDRGEKEMTHNGKRYPLIRHRGLPPPDYQVIFPFSEQKISLCMIARNEENCIAKALENVRDYVDEIILVDTGSTDKTCQIASSYGAKIYHHPWNDDFSESRNYSLSYATGDWIIVLDADEAINYLDLIYLKELSAQKGQHAYSVRQRHYINERNALGLIENDEWYNESIGYAGWLENIICRFFRRNPQVYFKRPVHEALEYRLKELGIMPLILQIPIHHYGKLSPLEIRNKKSQQYIDINKKYLERVTDREDLICGNYQIGQSLAAMRKPEKALAYLEEAVRLINQGEPFKGNDSQGGPVVALSTLYVMLNRPLDALKHLKRQVEIEPKNDDYWLALAQVYIQLKDFHAFCQSLDKCLSLNPENEKANRMKENLTKEFHEFNTYREVV